MGRHVTSRGRSGRQVTSLAGRVGKVVTAMGGRRAKAHSGHGSLVAVTGVITITLLMAPAGRGSASSPVLDAVTGTSAITLSMGVAGAGTFTPEVTGVGEIPLTFAMSATGTVIPPVTGTSDITLGLTIAGAGVSGAVTGIGGTALSIVVDGAGTHLPPVVGAWATVLGLTVAGVGQVLSPVVGAAAMTLTTTVAGTGTVGSGSAGIAVVGPHASYNGTAGSGATPPTDPVRTGPKAIGQIATCPGQRVSGQVLLKIPCDAYGGPGVYGVAQVNLTGDCAATTITAMSRVDFVDVNSVPHAEFYHAVYLDAAAFVAAGGVDGTRAATVYAEIVPTLWPTVQKRVLSFTFYPASTATDGTYNVGSGQTYSTIKAALSQARTDGKKAPRVQIKVAGEYEMEDSTWGIHTAGQGFAVITHDPGVTATLRRAADFNPTNQASWKWTPGWDGIEFRGSGIVIDTKNTTQIAGSTKPCFFNGCQITNSIGTRDSLYWNKSPHPGWGVNVASWWQYHAASFTSALHLDQLACIGGTTNGALGDVYSGTPLVYGQHDQHANSQFYRNPLKAMTIRYTGAGAGTISKTAPNGGGVLTLVDPAGSLPITLGAVNSLVEISAVVALINARTGWSATAFDTARAARHLAGHGFGNTQEFHDVDAKTAVLQLDTQLDYHGDGTQTYGGRQNYVYWNWRVDTDIDMSQVFRFDGRTDPGGTLGDRDMSFVNCIALADNSGTLGLGGTGDHHRVFRHLTTNIWVAIDTGTQEIYTEMTNSIVGGVGTGDPTSTPAVNFRDNLHSIPNGAVAFAGPTFTGNVSYGNAASVDAYSLLNAPPSDCAPIGLALTTQYASVFPYDARGVLRSATDSAGAWSKNVA